MRDPYQVLGVSPNASEDEIKSAYKKLAKKYHPDVTGNSPEAEAKMQEINAAYDQIMNKKTSYDPFSSQSRTQGSSSDEPLAYQAAYNYIRFHRYAEALNALGGIDTSQRTARWYYLSATANAGVGNYMQARLDARKACSLEPDNMEYADLARYLDSNQTSYNRQRNNNYTVYTGGASSFCLTLMAAQCCCWCCF